MTNSGFIKKSLLAALFFFSVAICAGAQNRNPIVNRTSAQEIAECKTPAAVAYNYVVACLNKDRSKIIELSTPDMQEYLSDQDQYNEFMSMFSNPEYEKLHIESWLPIPAGCEICVLYVQAETPSNYPLGTIKKVYINVVPTVEIGCTGFQDITRMFNTNVKVLVYRVNGRWLAGGFK